MAWNGLNILAALADGPKLTRQIAAGLGLQANSARHCLDALRRKGLVASAEGTHQITEAGRAAQAEAGAA